MDSRKITRTNHSTGNNDPDSIIVVRAGDYNHLKDDFDANFSDNGAATLDTIAEKTVGSGVTIDGVLIKDGIVTTTGPIIASVDPAIAATGTTNADAYAITEAVNVITSGGAATGVILPAAVVGLQIVIVNKSASTNKVYANAADVVDDETHTTGYITIQDNDVITFSCYTTTLWQSDSQTVDSYSSMSVNNALTTGASLKIADTGVYTGTGIIHLTADAATSGVGIFVTMDGLTSGKAVSINSSSTGLTTAGNLVYIGAAGDFNDAGGQVVEIESVHTTGTGVQLTMDAITDGIGLAGTFDALTTGEALSFTHTTSVIADGGSMVNLSSTGVDTAATTGAVLNISSTAQAAGNTVLIASNGLTTGTAVEISSTGTIVAAGDVLSVVANTATTSTGLLRVSGTALTDGWVGQLTGSGATATATGGVLDVVAGASTLGSAVRITSTGAATSTTVGHLLELVDDANALGIGVHATFDGLTTGEGFLITHTTSVIADGGSLVRLSSTGVNTGGSTNGAVLDVIASGQVAGVVAKIATAALTTGKAVEVTANLLTTGNILELASSSTVIDTAGRMLLITHSGNATANQDALVEFNSAAADNTTIFQLTASAALAAGIALDIDVASMTTGTGIRIDGADALTTGVLIDIESAATAITGAGRMFKVDHSGATSTSGVLAEFLTAATDETVLCRYTASGTLEAGTVIDVVANSMTTGTALSISSTALTTGTALNVTATVTTEALAITGYVKSGETIGDAAASPYYNIKTLKYTIGAFGVANVDYNTGNAGDKTEYCEQLGAGAIIPSLCQVLNVVAVCTVDWEDAGTGGETMGTVLGNATSGDQYVTTANVDAVGDLMSCAADGLGHIQISYSATSVWIGLTPTTYNWDVIDAGVTTIYITYLDNTGVA